MCEVQGFRAIRRFKSLKQRLEKAMNQDEKESLEEQKEAALKTHIGYMLNLFVMACSIPAGIRLAGCIAGSEDGLLPTILIVAIVFVLQSIANRYLQKLFSSLPSRINDDINPIHGDSISYNSMSK